MGILLTEETEKNIEKPFLEWQFNKVEKTKTYSADIIGFMSGKGGVGKTGLSINIANFCSNFGKKVLLIDGDLSTNGATAFFRINNATRNRMRSTNYANFQGIMANILNGTIFEQDNEKDEKIFSVRENFDFIPARLSADIFNEQELTEKKILEVESKLEQLFGIWKSSYDLIILDCGAGYNKINSLLKSYVEKICVVMENSDISREATQKSLSELIRTTEIENIICCINMLKRTEHTDFRVGLLNEFLGFTYKEEYSKLYEKGEMIEIKDSDLCHQLAKIVEKVYIEGTQLKEIYKKQTDEHRRKIEWDERIKKKHIRNIRIVITVLVVCGLIAGMIAAFTLKKMWSVIPVYIYILIVISILLLLWVGCGVGNLYNSVSKFLSHLLFEEEE